MSCDEHWMVVEELNRAQELTSQLQAVLLPLLLPGSRRSELARDHLREMIRCSTSALSALQACGSPASGFDMIAADGQRMSPEHEKVRKDREGGRSWPPKDAKRRQARNEDSWSIITTTPHEDGHKWRKCGERQIRGSKRPRSYYRCVYGKEQGCGAKKTIQEEDIEYNPPKYRVVYAIVHACASTSPPLLNNNLVPLLDTSFDLNNVEFSAKQKVVYPLPYEGGKNEMVLELPISTELDAIFEAMMDTYFGRDEVNNLIS
ncbi:hypothetical protein ZIOFF_058149 [Zingiber officinale]|uniref:WRKY domain-containing protein n=1 Tax=Zingiber officinale TaxID=94328 RepID=A0A8J5KAP3_ZINOF|nr:hypothetical protein ZIOFF_058149 [Zingiber officinale]